MHYRWLIYDHYWDIMLEHYVLIKELRVCIDMDILNNGTLRTDVHIPKTKLAKHSVFHTL